jgi:hypothetical protein
VIRHHREVDIMDRLEQIVARLPEAVRVGIEAWDGEPTFRVRGKNFVFCDRAARRLTVKLPKEEAEAMVGAGDAEPTGYGLGRFGWVTFSLTARASAARWREVEELVRTSFTMVAPKKLGHVVLDEDDAVLD